MRCPGCHYSSTRRFYPRGCHDWEPTSWIACSQQTQFLSIQESRKTVTPGTTGRPPASHKAVRQVQSQPGFRTPSRYPNLDAMKSPIAVILGHGTDDHGKGNLARTPHQCLVIGPSTGPRRTLPKESPMSWSWPIIENLIIRAQLLSLPHPTAC